MGYQKSEKHLDNIRKAGEKAREKTELCPYCNKIFSKSGMPNHLRKCSKGKKCPVCCKWFSSKGTTCSHTCANTYFKSGINHGNWKESSYRTTCFYYHKKECIVCGESNIVEVHHLDHNKQNNSPENLVPLCPTHHQYWHSGYRHLVEKQVREYVNTFIRDNS